MAIGQGFIQLQRHRAREFRAVSEAEEIEQAEAQAAGAARAL